jgi:serine/threonine protein kinase
VDWPSRELSRRLAEWGLCQPEDVTHSRRFVRALARDLPAFDSVWIDALVRGRAITSYQARILDSHDPDRLRIGPWVLVDRLEDDSWRGVFRAHRVDDRQHQILTVHRRHRDDVESCLQSLTETLHPLRGRQAGCLSLPTAVDHAGDDILVVSPDVQGHSLRDLLIRRGRFPHPVVAAIARSLIAGLAALEAHGGVHGDLRLRNARLLAEGELRVLQAGVLPALMPRVDRHLDLPLDCYDGLAPELGAGGPHSGLTDQYALGCLLWQLLAGRPPFATGDPLGKVTAHQSRMIPDIRDWAPATPRLLADSIRQMTSRSPFERAASFRELAMRFGSPPKSDRRLLRQFLQSHQSDDPRQTAPEVSATRRAMPTIATTLILGAMTTWLVMWEGRRPAANHPGKTIANSQSKNSGKRKGSSKPTSPVQTASYKATETPAFAELPAPDATGTIWLSPGRVYRSRILKSPAPLTIRASDSGLAQVVVPAEGWDVIGETLRFQNVEVRCESSKTSLRVGTRSRLLEWVHCRLGSSASSPQAVIEWQPADASSAAANGIRLENCELPNATLRCSIRPAFIELKNCLKTGPAPLCELSDQGRPQQSVAIQLERTTLRESGPLAQWKPGSRALGLRVQVGARQCVFDVSSPRSLLEIDALSKPADWERSVSISGLETVVTPSTGLIRLSGDGAAALDANSLDADGLLSGGVQFRDSNLNDAAASEVIATETVRSASRPPGIDSRLLPRVFVENSPAISALK